MSIIDKIKNTVEEKNLVDKAKGATMIITEAVGKGKQGLENKYQENMQKIEEEKKYIAALGENFINEVKNNYKEEDKSINEIPVEKLISFTDEFYEKIYMTRNNSSSSDLELGDYIEEKYSNKIISQFNKEIDEEEKSVLCYYNNSKDKFLFTTKSFYFRMKHPKEDYIYSAKINNEFIKSINIIRTENEALLAINDVPAFVVKSEYIDILNDYFTKLNNQELFIKEEEISKIIEESLDEESLLKIKESLEEDEHLLLIASKANIICTNKKIMVLTGNAVDGINIVNKLNYTDIDYIGIEKLDGDSLLNRISTIFNDTTLEICLLGNKVKIENLKQIQGQKIIDLVNKYKRYKEESNIKNVVELDSTLITKVKEEDVFTAIRKLSELKDSGILTEEEFKSKKEDLLKRI